MLHGAAPAPNQVHDQRHHQQHQEYEEKDLRDAGGSGSNSAEAEDTGDDRHDEEHKSPVKHGRPPESFAAWRQPRGDTAGCRGNAPSAGWVPIEDAAADGRGSRTEEHTSALQSLMRISYAVFCLQKKIQT